MDSPFAKDPKHEDASPARRIFLLLILIAIVGAVAAVAMGYVHIRFGKDELPAPRDEAGGTAVLVKRDEATEKTLRLLLEDPHVVRSRSVRVQFRLEGEMDGKKQVLAQSPLPTESKADSIEGIEGMAAWVLRDDSVDAYMSFAGAGSHVKNVAFPRPQLAGKSNKIQVRSQWHDIGSDLKAQVGKEVEVYKLQEFEVYGKEEKGSYAIEKEVPRRTLRLIAHILAVSEEPRTK